MYQLFANNAAILWLNMRVFSDADCVQDIKNIILAYLAEMCSNNIKIIRRTLAIHEYAQEKYITISGNLNFIISEKLDYRCELNKDTYLLLGIGSYHIYLDYYVNSIHTINFQVSNVNNIIIRGILAGCMFT